MEALATPSAERGEIGEAHLPACPNKYHYPEFAGWNGERYLKKLLRQILPMALYRTWEIFADHQAPENECFLGVQRLAEIAGRAPRTIEKNLAELCAKQLLVERVERKLFHEVNGTWKNRAVVVKDFSGLYTLAHEYHEWLCAEEYVEADRELVKVVTQEPGLLAKLRRFENYRRVLYHRSPGPVPRVREEERWFAEYPARSCTDEREKSLKEVNCRRSGTISSKHSTEKVAEYLPEDSAERITDTSQRNLPNGDSSDSAPFSSEKSFQSREILGVSETARQDRHRVGVGTSPAAEQERSTLPARRGRGASSEQGEPESDPPMSPGQTLARTFLSEIAAPFGDRNPRGSLTRALGIIQKAHLERPDDVLACLVRAYVVARDTRAIRPEHYHPQTGQANRMPLFCAMFQRFAETYRQNDHQDYAWRQMEEDIADDEHLTRWWEKQQGLISERTSRHADERQKSLSSGVAASSPEAGPIAAPMLVPRKRRSRLSQTEEKREERAALARKVRTRLFKMSVPIQEPIVLWEHPACGCPLYHTRQGKEVCALCCPDITWPEDVLTLIRSIVEPGTAANGPKRTNTHELVSGCDRWDQNKSVNLEEQRGPDREAGVS